ncbi:MAG: hypothetical protein JXR91_10845 [Deltaproteobacteria bacterium]|nr:hypothetical protein [Deltaproteobacteria bacterium]
MKYLYGNSNVSNLSQNYLEFLRLALDFSVSVLQSETKIFGLHEAIKQEERNVDDERGRVAVIEQSVSKLVEEAKAAQVTTIGNALCQNIQAACGREIANTQSQINTELKSFTDRSMAEIKSERAANVPRVEKILLSSDFPNSVNHVKVTANETGNYVCSLNAVSDGFIKFDMDLSVPSGNLFSEPFKVESLQPDLQVDLPDGGGWLKRTSKIVSQNLSKEFVTGFVQKDEGTLISLRGSHKEGQPGYDILVKSDSVYVTRITKQQEDSTPYKVLAVGEEKLRKLYLGLLNAVEDIAVSRVKLTSATIGSESLATFAEPHELVFWLLEQMTPVVLDISHNSLSPTELVLKRVLGDDRREEVFISKSELFDKLSELTDANKTYFSPLGLDRDNQNMSGLPAPQPSKLQDYALPSVTASQNASIDQFAQETEEMLEIESDHLLPDEPTAEIDLDDLDDDKDAPIPGVSSRPSVTPPPRSSVMPPPVRTSAAPPPRPSMLPGARPSVLPGARPSVLPGVKKSTSTLSKKK